jgi:hypothetical protein
VSESLRELQERIDGIEESYEFQLAYAAQGLSTHEATSSGTQLREYLTRTARSLDVLADLFDRVVAELELQPAEHYHEYVKVLREDARKAGAGVRLTLAQRAISSQLIDNLNASIHIRAMLTDVFLLDELIAPLVAASAG